MLLLLLFLPLVRYLPKSVGTTYRYGWSPVGIESNILFMKYFSHLFLLLVCFREECLESWSQIRMTPMFGCICPNNHFKKKCERIFTLVNHNPCLGKRNGARKEIGNDIVQLLRIYKYILQHENTHLFHNSSFFIFSSTYLNTSLYYSNTVYTELPSIWTHVPLSYAAASILIVLFCTGFDSVGPPCMNFSWHCTVWL